MANKSVLHVIKIMMLLTFMYQHPECIKTYKYSVSKIYIFID